jgi:hypothetical protein
MSETRTRRIHHNWTCPNNQNSPPDTMSEYSTHTVWLTPQLGTVGALATRTGGGQVRSKRGDFHDIIDRAVVAYSTCAVPRVAASRPQPSTCTDSKPAPATRTALKADVLVEAGPVAMALDTVGGAHLTGCTRARVQQPLSLSLNAASGPRTSARPPQLAQHWHPTQ